MGNGQGAENEEVEEVGEKHIPLEDGGNAHGNKGIENEEKMVIHLEPVRRRPWKRLAAHCGFNDRVVDRP